MFFLVSLFNYYLVTVSQCRVMHSSFWVVHSFLEFNSELDKLLLNYLDYSSFIHKLPLHTTHGIEYNTWTRGMYGDVVRNGIGSVCITHIEKEFV